MGVKNDRWIRNMALEHGMIEPFADKQIREGISYGVGSYGYDFRIDREFKIFQPDENISLIDPKNVNPASFQTLTNDYCDIPANSFVIARTIEYFRIPRDVVTICFGKSTYARSGIYSHITPFEPEWEGFATIAISNANSCPARIYANEGIAQLLFIAAEDVCAISYADKKGKYQGQSSITLSKGNG